MKLFTGYRIQHNNILGPYKGGIRYHESVKLNDVKPLASMVGNTVRVTFPFDVDPAAAVFRRGDGLWMLFDSDARVMPTDHCDALSSIASGFDVVPTG